MEKKNDYIWQIYDKNTLPTLKYPLIVWFEYPPIKQQFPCFSRDFSPDFSMFFKSYSYLNVGYTT